MRLMSHSVTKSTVSFVAVYVCAYVTVCICACSVEGEEGKRGCEVLIS